MKNSLNYHIYSYIDLYTETLRRIIKSVRIYGVLNLYKCKKRKKLPLSPAVVAKTVVTRNVMLRQARCDCSAAVSGTAACSNTITITPGARHSLNGEGESLRCAVASS